MLWSDFSVIIVTKNRYHQLSESISSICNNSIKPKNIIIIDGSIIKKENTIFLIKSICNKSKIQLKYIYSYENLAQCRNIGISKVDTKYFGFIDDDQYTPNTWVSNVKNIFTKNPEVDILIGPLSSRYLKNYWNSIWFDINKYQLKTEAKVNFAPGANTCYKTSFLKQNHIYFDKRFTFAAEDWGISYLLNKSNAFMYQTPRLTVLHDCRTTIFSFMKQWFSYGIGIHQYHYYYLLKKEKNFINKSLSVIKLLFSSYPIYPNSKKPYLYPGYTVLNLSYLVGYLQSLILLK